MNLLRSYLHDNPWRWEYTTSNDKDYDVYDNGNGTRTLRLPVPGLAKEDLKITQEGSIILIETITNEPKGPKVVFKGIPDKFTYKFDITGFRVEDANCGKGVLEILLVEDNKSGIIKIK